MNIIAIIVLATAVGMLLVALVFGIRAHVADEVAPLGWAYAFLYSAFVAFVIGINILALS